MQAVYGELPLDLASPPPGAVQLSPLMPGSAAIETLADGTLHGLVMHAPRGTLERRYALAHGLRALRVGAPLTVLAQKKQGGTRLHDELDAFGCVVEETSKQHFRICTARRPESPVGLGEAIGAGRPQLAPGLDLWSQPGVFSWDRIDPASALLIKHLPALSGRGADLGCGIGVLARAVMAEPDVRHVTLIDIDRRAIAAACRNVEDTRAAFVWADIRKAGVVPSNLDFVVMNPPFHDGGLEDQGLGRLFLQRAAVALRPGGLCLVTANRHLPYEAAMCPLFADVEQIVQDHLFKVYALRK